MEPMEALDRGAGEFARRLALVTDDQWALPTPCEDWSVRDLVAHVVGGNQMSAVLLSGGTREDAAGALKSGWRETDLRQGYESSAAAQRAGFADGQDLGRTVPHPNIGDITAAQLFGFRIADLTLHAWDLARAIGANERLDDELVELVYAGMQPLTPFIAQTGMFGSGPSGEHADDVPTQTRMLDLSGRRP